MRTELTESTYWETIADPRWGRYVSQLEKAAILRAHNLATAPTDALEIGCEGGRWSRMLSDLGWRLTCTDIDSQLLHICQKRLPDARCVLVDPDSVELPCEAASIGLLLCIEVEGVMHADWFREEAYRVLQA